MRLLKLLFAASLVASGGVSAAPAADVRDLQRLAQAGDARAAHRLALAYRNGDGADADPVEARAWLLRSAQAGHAPAMFILANMLEAGEGGKADPGGARAWYETAAESEYPEALQHLALNEPDPRRADLLMRRAAHALQHRAHD